MPKKTRQEKILARLRRLEREQNIPDEALKTETPKISFEPKYSAPSSTSPATKIEVVDYAYVYKDLVKSLVFAALAIFFQILLSVFFIK